MVSSAKSIKTNVALNTFRMMLTVLMPLITFPYVSRILSVDGMGQINFAASVYAIFSLLATLGIYAYGVREGSKVRDDKEAFSHLGQEIVVLNVVSTALSYVVFFACLAFVPAFADRSAMLLIYGIGIFFTGLGCDWVYGVYEEYTYITIRQIAVQITTLVLMFVLVHGPEDIYIWAGISVLSGAGANIFNMVRARRYISLKKTAQWHLGRHIVPILVLFATQLASKVYVNLDTVMLGVLSTDSATGVYSAAVKVNLVLVTVFSAMSPVFIPRLMGHLSAGEGEAYDLLLRKVLRLTLSLAVPLVVGIEMLRGPIIALLAGPDFAPAADTMTLLAPIVLLAAVADVLYYDVIVLHGGERAVLACTLTASIINFILALVLIPCMAENGAALASLASEGVALAMALIIAFKTTRLSRACLPRLLPYAIGGIVVAVCCWLSITFTGGAVTQLLVAVAASVVAYMAVLIAFRDPVADEVLLAFGRVARRLRAGKEDE